MKLALVDGLRHTNLTGYGALSRNIIFGLDELGHELYLQPRGEREWGRIEDGARERLESFPELGDLAGVEMVLQVGTPGATKRFAKPSLMYTQNAIGGLRDDWVTALRQADGAIVPSEFDRRVFAQHLDRVYVARQSSDPKIFRPQAAWKEEESGDGEFTFLFVGSYSYRKGIDLLLEAFLAEFDSSESVYLHIHAPGVGADLEFNHLLSSIQRLNATGHVRLFGQDLSPEWMCRIYNRADCLITLSRGEGWCMPITEALLCETPVIAPDSTGMAEYLSEEIAYLVPTREREIGQIDDPFAGSFAQAYGQPGSVCHEPETKAARAKMREVVSDPGEARRKAILGRKVIADSVSWENAVKDIERACLDLLGSSDARATG